MVKINRNDSCPCGSGKKYKKCCIGKLEELKVKQEEMKISNPLLTYEKIDKLSTDEITQKLAKMGIPFNKELFLKDIERFYSAEAISENWFEQYKVTAKGLEEDFPWLAAWVLWVRMAPLNKLSLEQMDDMIKSGYDNLDTNLLAACETWLQVWEAIKHRTNAVFQTLDYLNKQYEGCFFIRNICQDLENALYNAGLEDSTYFEKRITYCREFCALFPKESQLIIHNMRRAIGESFARLGKYEEAEVEFLKLVEDFPENPWGYVGWGDMYFFGPKKDYDKARQIFKKGLAIAKDKEEILALIERIEDIENM
ncbi:SEC-C metal-binding domain-containing protein [Bacillus sp. FJAT-45066]|uniref:SEC-C metal-binding domain-containing protein n=1 Tax=Bacillus sp. FJAT-45066 TaxID=2011010 RepID=UPI000BB88DED|nr:SEC-C metal-binding domain-containing protein [Bacillus sp. FJAT-45066]